MILYYLTGCNSLARANELHELLTQNSKTKYVMNINVDVIYYHSETVHTELKQTTYLSSNGENKIICISRLREKNTTVLKEHKYILKGSLGATELPEKNINYYFNKEKETRNLITIFIFKGSYKSNMYYTADGDLIEIYYFLRPRAGYYIKFYNTNDPYIITKWTGHQLSDVSVYNITFAESHSGYIYDRHEQ